MEGLLAAVGIRFVLFLLPDSGGIVMALGSHSDEGNWNDRR